MTTTTTVEMLDSVTASNIPLGTTYAAGYVDGEWPSYNGIVQRLPTAVVKSITVSYGTRAQIIDMENGDATAMQAVLQVKAGLSNTIYCDYSNWVDQVLPAAKTAGVTPFYWIASYLTSNPTTLPTIPADWIARGVVAWQFFDTGPYDRSVALLSWLQPPLPPPKDEDDVTFGTLTIGGKECPAVFYATATGGLVARVQTSPTGPFSVGTWEWFDMDNAQILTNGSAPAVA